MDWFVTPYLKFIYWNFCSQCDAIWRCGLWDGTWVRWGPESGALMIGLVVLQERRVPLPFSPCAHTKDTSYEEVVRRWLSATQEEGPHWRLIAGSLVLVSPELWETLSNSMLVKHSILTILQSSSSGKTWTWNSMWRLDHEQLHHLYLSSLYPKGKRSP